MFGDSIKLLKQNSLNDCYNNDASFPDDDIDSDEDLIERNKKSVLRDLMKELKSPKFPKAN